MNFNFNKEAKTVSAMCHGISTGNKWQMLESHGEPRDIEALLNIAKELSIDREFHAVAAGIDESLAALSVKIDK